MSRKHTGARALAFAVGFSVGLAVALTPPPAMAKKKGSDAEVKAACGRKAKDAGVSGEGAVKAFVANCVDQMRANQRANEQKKNEKGSKEKKHKK